MNPERWQAIGDIFERALAFPTRDRTHLIDQASGGDEEVQREVESLLASHAAAAGGFVQDRIKSAIASFVESGVLGGEPARVGSYRLVRELGRGGMGTVFLAERDDDQYHAQVAVKLVRPGMDTEFIVARFRRERQTLARLQHPNISRLLDGGTTDSGLPYIVMEYIDGERLTDFAERRRLSIDDRLRLFLDVCAAVDYAHRNFVIHRDLKPGNILVDRDGAPKLLDFGICKLLHTELSSGDDTAATPMTPNYASPEQLCGEPATMLSDVYSLGAVLYELLTGKGPRRFEKLAPLAIEQVVRQQAIARPSDAANHKIAARQLAGDLDNIVMHALEPEPPRRYESAAQLADDLRRYLNHEPVRARPQTMRYRAVKFVRRNRGEVAALAALFLMLIGGLTVSIHEARIAGSRLEQIRTMADKLVFDVHDAVRDLPGATQARQAIVQTGLEYLDSSVNSVKGDSAAEKQLAKAYRRLGDVQGDVQAANLGDPAGALTRYRRALSLLDDAIRRAPGDADAQTERLIVYSRIGSIQAYTKNLREAVDTFRTGLRTGAAFASSGSPELKTALGDLYLESSQAKRNLNDYAASLVDAEECLRLYREVAAVRQSDAHVDHSLSNAYAAVGMAESGLGKLQEALAHFRQGTATMAALVASNPRNVSWRRDLMLAYGHIGDVLGNSGLQNLGDRAGALHAYRQAAEIGRTLYEDDPADQRAAADYGIVLNRVETVMDDRDLPAKLAVQQQSLRVLQQAATISPGNVSLQIYLAFVNQRLGDSFTAGADLEAARRAYAASVAIAESNVESGHVSLYTTVIQSNRRLALNAVARGRRSEALDFARRTLHAAQHPPADAGPTPAAVPRGLAAMGLTYAALARSPLREADDREQALSWLRKSLDAWHGAQQSDPGFGSPQQREMREVEEMLARVQQQRTR